MRVFAAVLLCIVVAVFGQEGPPDTLMDEKGNKFIVKTNGESMQLFNDTGSLVSSVLNSNGWVVVISSDRDVCIISNPRTCPRQCFTLVPFVGRVDDNVLDFCKGRPIMQQVAVPCDQNMVVTTTASPVASSDDAAQIASLTVALPDPILHTWPLWSCCCRWRRIGWWPCLEPVCYADDGSDTCLKWGCANWGWHWHWIQDCSCGWEWPFFLHHG